MTNLPSFEDRRQMETNAAILHQLREGREKYQLNFRSTLYPSLSSAVHQQQQLLQLAPIEEEGEGGGSENQQELTLKARSSPEAQGEQEEEEEDENKINNLLLRHHDQQQQPETSAPHAMFSAVQLHREILYELFDSTIDKKQLQQHQMATAATSTTYASPPNVTASANVLVVEKRRPVALGGALGGVYTQKGLLHMPPHTKIPHEHKHDPEDVKNSKMQKYLPGIMLQEKANKILHENIDILTLTKSFELPRPSAVPSGVSSLVVDATTTCSTCVGINGSFNAKDKPPLYRRTTKQQSSDEAVQPRSTCERAGNLSSLCGSTSPVAVKKAEEISVFASSGNKGGVKKTSSYVKPAEKRKAEAPKGLEIDCVLDDNKRKLSKRFTGSMRWEPVLLDVSEIENKIMEEEGEDNSTNEVVMPRDAEMDVKAREKMENRDQQKSKKKKGVSMSKAAPLLIENTQRQRGGETTPPPSVNGFFLGLPQNGGAMTEVVKKKTASSFQKKVQKGKEIPHHGSPISLHEDRPTESSPTIPPGRRVLAPLAFPLTISVPQPRGGLAGSTEIHPTAALNFPVTKTAWNDQPAQQDDIFCSEVLTTMVKKNSSNKKKTKKLEFGSMKNPEEEVYQGNEREEDPQAYEEEKEVFVEQHLTMEEATSMLRHAETQMLLPSLQIRDAVEHYNKTVKAEARAKEKMYGGKRGHHPFALHHLHQGNKQVDSLQGSRRAIVAGGFGVRRSLKLRPPISYGWTEGDDEHEEREKTPLQEASHLEDTKNVFTVHQEEDEQKKVKKSHLHGQKRKAVSIFGGGKQTKKGGYVPLHLRQKVQEEHRKAMESYEHVDINAMDLEATMLGFKHDHPEQGSSTTSSSQKSEEWEYNEHSDGSIEEEGDKNGEKENQEEKEKEGVLVSPRHRIEIVYEEGDDIEIEENIPSNHEDQDVGNECGKQKENENYLEDIPVVMESNDEEEDEDAQMEKGKEKKIGPEEGEKDVIPENLPNTSGDIEEGEVDLLSVQSTEGEENGDCRKMENGDWFKPRKVDVNFDEDGELLWGEESGSSSIPSVLAWNDEKEGEEIGKSEQTILDSAGRVHRTDILLTEDAEGKSASATKKRVHWLLSQNPTAFFLRHNKKKKGMHNEEDDEGLLSEPNLEAGSGLVAMVDTKEFQETVEGNEGEEEEMNDEVTDHSKALNLVHRPMGHLGLVIEDYTKYYDFTKRKDLLLANEMYQYYTSPSLCCPSFKLLHHCHQKKKRRAQQQETENEEEGRKVEEEDTTTKTTRTVEETFHVDDEASSLKTRHQFATEQDPIHIPFPSLSEIIDIDNAGNIALVISLTYHQDQLKQGLEDYLRGSHAAATSSPSLSADSGETSSTQNAPCVDARVTAHALRQQGFFVFELTDDPQLLALLEAENPTSNPEHLVPRRDTVYQMVRSALANTHSEAVCLVYLFGRGGYGYLPGSAGEAIADDDEKESGDTSSDQPLHYLFAADSNLRDVNVNDVLVLEHLAKLSYKKTNKHGITRKVRPIIVAEVSHPRAPIYGPQPVFEAHYGIVCEVNAVVGGDFSVQYVAAEETQKREIHEVMVKKTRALQEEENQQKKRQQKKKQMEIEEKEEEQQAGSTSVRLCHEGSMNLMTYYLIKAFNVAKMTSTTSSSQQREMATIDGGKHLAETLRGLHLNQFLPPAAIDPRILTINNLNLYLKSKLQVKKKSKRQEDHNNTSAARSKPTNIVLTNACNHFKVQKLMTDIGRKQADQIKDKPRPEAIKIHRKILAQQCRLVSDVFSRNMTKLFSNQCIQRKKERRDAKVFLQPLKVQLQVLVNVGFDRSPSHRQKCIHEIEQYLATFLCRHNAPEEEREESELQEAVRQEAEEMALRGGKKKKTVPTKNSQEQKLSGTERRINEVVEEDDDDDDDEEIDDTVVSLQSQKKKSSKSRHSQKFHRYFQLQKLLPRISDFVPTGIFVALIDPDLFANNTLSSDAFQDDFRRLCGTLRKNEKDQNISSSLEQTGYVMGTVSNANPIAPDIFTHFLASDAAIVVDVNLHFIHQKQLLLEQLNKLENERGMKKKREQEIAARVLEAKERRGGKKKRNIAEELSYPVAPVDSDEERLWEADELFLSGTHPLQKEAAEQQKGSPCFSNGTTLQGAVDSLGSTIHVAEQLQQKLRLIGEMEREGFSPTQNLEQENISRKKNKNNNLIRIRNSPPQIQNCRHSLQQKYYNENDGKLRGNKLSIYQLQELCTVHLEVYSLSVYDKLVKLLRVGKYDMMGGHGSGGGVSAFGPLSTHEIPTDATTTAVAEAEIIENQKKQSVQQEEVENKKEDVEIKAEVDKTTEGGNQDILENPSDDHHSNGLPHEKEEDGNGFNVEGQKTKPKKVTEIRSNRAADATSRSGSQQTIAQLVQKAFRNDPTPFVNHFRLLSLELLESSVLKHSAAKKIQTLVRGFLARRWIKHIVIPKFYRPVYELFYSLQGEHLQLLWGDWREEDTTITTEGVPKIIASIDENKEKEETAEIEEHRGQQEQQVETKKSDEKKREDSKKAADEVSHLSPTVVGFGGLAKQEQQERLLAFQKYEDHNRYAIEVENREETLRLVGKWIYAWSGEEAERRNVIIAEYHLYMFLMSENMHRISVLLTEVNLSRFYLLSKRMAMLDRDEISRRMKLEALFLKERAALQQQHVMTLPIFGSST